MCFISHIFKSLLLWHRVQISTFAFVPFKLSVGQTKNEDGSYESVLPPDCTLLDDANSQLFKDAVGIVLVSVLFGQISDVYGQGMDS